MSYLLYCSDLVFWGQIMMHDVQDMDYGLLTWSVDPSTHESQWDALLLRVIDQTPESESTKP